MNNGEIKIIVAKDAGFCFGVRDAVKTAFDSSSIYGNVYMLGDIVHNEKIVSDLTKSNVKVVDGLNEIPGGNPVLFRAHGTKPEIWQGAKKRGLKIIDATCPLVHEIHTEVKKLAEEGRKIIVIGDHDHDEVIGITSQVEGTIVISNPQEVENLPKIKKAGVVSQSTQAF